MATEDKRIIRGLRTSDEPNSPTADENRNSDSLPILGGAKIISSPGIPVFEPPAHEALSEADVADILGVERSIGMPTLRSRLVGMLAEVNRLAQAEDNYRQFQDIVAEAAKKGDEHKARVLKLAGARLTLAKIYYHFPDHPGVITYHPWQEVDVAPKFPILRAFLDFWEKTLEGKLHSVEVIAAKVFSIDELRVAASSHTMN